MKILTLLIASIILVNSCDKKQAQTTETSDVTTPTIDSAKVTDTISSTVTEVKDGVVIQGTTSGSTNVAVNNPTGKSAKPALNPEHGQPFHRCEIPVGAPIDSAPSQNPTPQVVPQQSTPNNSFNTNPISPSLAPSSAPVQATGPKPANNPAHGEPHHRCDLEVGAPLI